MKIPYGVALVAFLLTATPAIADYQYYNNDRGGGYYYEAPQQRRVYRADDGYYRRSEPRNSFGIQPSIGLDYVYSDVELDTLPDEIPNTFNSFNIALGAKFGRYVGLEGFYQKSGNATEDIYDTGIKIKTSFQAYGADLNFYGPTQYDHLDFLLALGGAQYKFEGKLFDLKEKEDCFGARVGVGLQVNFNEHFAIRALGRVVWLDSDYLDYIKEFTIGGRVYF